MDSKDVNAAIRREVWPLLRDIGFETIAGRTAWRHTTRRIHVVNFQSFNSHNADVIGCTTFSFAVNLGCFLPSIPDVWERVVSKRGRLQPKEYECPFRGPVQRSFEQQELARRDIWYIDEAGGYLSKALHDVRMTLASSGMQWFARLDDDAEVLRILLNDEEDISSLWGFGNRPSPIRNYFTGYAAAAAGRGDIAARYLEAAASSPTFERLKPRIEAMLQQVRLAG